MKEKISIEDFAKADLRVGKILSAELHPKADKLLVLQVDLGEEKPRQIVAGIRALIKFTDIATNETVEKPDSLIGTPIVVVANLVPATIRGVESNGMLLAASSIHGFPVLVQASSIDVKPGTEVK